MILLYTQLIPEYVLHLTSRALVRTTRTGNFRDLRNTRAIKGRIVDNLLLRRARTAMRATVHVFHSVSKQHRFVRCSLQRLVS